MWPLNVNRVVLDASALLALLNDEPGTDQLTAEVLNRAFCSTVNLAEVHSKLVREGVPAAEAWESTMSSIREAVPFTLEQARMAGNLVMETRALGLSLGDRACIACGLALRAPIFTADKSWMKLKLDVQIHVIR